MVVYDVDRELLVDTLASISDPAVRSIRVHVNGGAEVEAWIREASAEGTLPPSLVITASENLGFAGGQNKLLADSFREGASHALVLNPDLILTSDGLSEMLGISRELGDRHLVAGTLLLGHRDDRQALATTVDTTGVIWTASSRHLDRFQGFPVEKTGVDSTELMPGVSGALILVPVDAWRRVIGVCGEFFDDDFFAYREDAELGIRARALGIGSFVIPTAVGTHYRGTPGTSRKNPVTNRLGVRNRFLIRSKWGYAGRPGAASASFARDLVVVAGVVAVERSSMGGLLEARRLRRVMRAKRRTLWGAVRSPRVGSTDDTGAWGARGVLLHAAAGFDDRVRSEAACAVVVCLAGHQPPLPHGDESGAPVVVVSPERRTAEAIATTHPTVAVVYLPAADGYSSCFNEGVRWAVAWGAQRITVSSESWDEGQSPSGSWFDVDVATMGVVGLMDESLRTELAIGEWGVRLGMGSHRPSRTATQVGGGSDYSWAARDGLLTLRSRDPEHWKLGSRAVALELRNLARRRSGSSVSRRGTMRAVVDGLLGRRGLAAHEYAAGSPIGVALARPAPTVEKQSQ